MNIDEAIDAIYDAKAGKFRDLGGEPITADNLPRKGDLIYTRGGEPFIAMADWENPAASGFILRRKDQPEPDLIYFPWPSGIDGIIGIIGPRGNIPANTHYDMYGNLGHNAGFGPCSHDLEQLCETGIRFPTDANLQWIRDESEVPPELLKEARGR